VSQAPRDEIRSPELLSSLRGRLLVAGLVALALAVVAVATLRPDRQGVGTPLAGASPAASPTPSESPSPSPAPAPSPSPTFAPPPVPPPLTAKTNSRLVVVQGTKLQVLDVDAGTRSTLPGHSFDHEYDRYDVLAVGRQLVMVGDNNTGAGSGPFPAYATTAGPGSRLRTLGQASYLLPSEHLDRVWLVAVKDTNDADAGATYSEVDLRGVVHHRAHFRFQVSPFFGGFFREAGPPGTDTGDTELVNAAGERLHFYPHSYVLAISGNTAVLNEDPFDCSRCTLRVLTSGPAQLSERHVVVDSLPRLSEIRLAEDGSRLLLGIDSESGDPQARVAQINLRSGEQSEITGAAAGTFYGPSFDFSGDGRWVFFTDADGKSVDVCDVVTGRAYRVAKGFDRITQLQVLAS
jgi:hypothetical protein